MAEDTALGTAKHCLPLCVCVCVCRGCGRLRVRVGWQVPHCLRHFCPNSAKRRKPWHPLPRPLPQSFPNGFRGASMSTHPSLPTCSPEPRATGLLCFSLSSLPSHSWEGHFLPPCPLSLCRGVGCSQGEEEEEEEGSSPKGRPTEHSSPEGGRWLKPKSLN